MTTVPVCGGQSSLTNQRLGHHFAPSVVDLILGTCHPLAGLPALKPWIDAGEAEVGIGEQAVAVLTEQKGSKESSRVRMRRAL